MMSEARDFDYHKFIRLAGSELCAYMEPLVADAKTLLSKEVFDRFLSELPEYDEYHLVYALQLGADHSIHSFLPHIPEYLLDERASVFCTAFNILNGLPNEYITQDLIDSVRGLVSSPAARKFVADLPDKLERRMRGT